MTITDNWTPLDAKAMSDMAEALLAHLTGQVHLDERVVDACVVAVLADIGLKTGLNPQDALAWAEAKAANGINVHLQEQEDGSLELDFTFHTEDGGEESWAATT